MTFSPTYPHRPLRLDLYVAQVQSSMMVHHSSDPSTALEQQMSRRGWPNGRSHLDYSLE